VAALQLGQPAWGRRLPVLLALVAERIFGIHGARVGWEHVADVSEVIHLDARASELGLGELDRKAGRWLARIPGG